MNRNIWKKHALLRGLVQIISNHKRTKHKKTHQNRFSNITIHNNTFIFSQNGTRNPNHRYSSLSFFLFLFLSSFGPLTHSYTSNYLTFSRILIIIIIRLPIITRKDTYSMCAPLTNGKTHTCERTHSPRLVYTRVPPTIAPKR